MRGLGVFAVVLTLGLCSAGAAANGRHVVADSQGLATALSQADAVEVALKGTLVVDPRHFRSSAIITGRQLTITSDGDAGGGVLDFGGTSDVLFVGEGGVLTLSKIRAQGMADPNGHRTPIAAFVLWPSIQLAPGGQVAIEHGTLRYPRTSSYKDCAAYQDDLQAALRSRYGDDAVVVEAPALLRITGLATATLELTSYGRAIGTAKLAVHNSTFVCEEAGASSGTFSGSAFGEIDGLQRKARDLLRWEVTAAALGTACAIAAVAICGLLAARSQARQEHRTALHAAKEEMAAVQQQLQLQSSQAGSAYAPGTPSIVHSGSDHGGGLHGGSSLSSLPLSRQTSLQASGGSLHRLSAGRLQLPPLGPVGADVEGEPLTARTDASADRLSAGAPGSAGSGGAAGTAPGRHGITADSHNSDHHSYLLKMRMEGGLEGIELGPPLGRGSYGKVYKGRWKGALVAIKVVEHNMGGTAIVVEGARESLLAASVSHPNVIACYKICTVRISKPSGPTKDADGFPMARQSSSPRSNANTDNTSLASVISTSEANAVVKQGAAWARARAASSAATASPASTVVEGGTGRTGRTATSSEGNSPGAQRRHSTAGSGSTCGSGGTATLAEELYASDPTLGPHKSLLPRLRSMDSVWHPTNVEVIADPAVEVPPPEDVPYSQGEVPDSWPVEEPQDAIETWMLLEYADRGSLEQAIQARRFQRKSDLSKVDLVAVYRTLMDVVSGMQYLHGIGLVHGDLKPANVLLKSTNTDSRGFIVKLADFGLSRLMDLHATHISTQTFGTVPYMPAELLSEGRMSRSADVFSFGMIAWQMWTGQQPYHGMSTMQVMYQVVNHAMRPDVPNSMPASYRALVEASWAERPEDRPTFDELHWKLAAVLEDELKSRASTRLERGFGAFGVPEAEGTVAASQQPAPRTAAKGAPGRAGGPSRPGSTGGHGGESEGERFLRLVQKSIEDGGPPPSRHGKGSRSAEGSLDSGSMRGSGGLRGNSSSPAEPVAAPEPAAAPESPGPAAAEAK